MKNMVKCFGSLMVMFVMLFASSSASAQFRARTYAEQTDDQQGLQFQLIYGTVPGGQDLGRDTNGEIVYSAFDLQNYFAGQLSGEFPRIATHNWMPDVLFLQLPQNQAFYTTCGARMEQCVEAGVNLTLLGYNLPANQRPAYQPNKINHVYAEMTNPLGCGDGRAPNTMGNTSVLFLDGTPPGSLPCNSQPMVNAITTIPDYPDTASSHEFGHDLEASQPGDPYYCGVGHTLYPTGLGYGAVGCDGTVPWAWKTGVTVAQSGSNYQQRLMASAAMQPLPSDPQMPQQLPVGVLPNYGANSTLKATGPYFQTQLGILNGLKDPVRVYSLDGNGNKEYLICHTLPWNECTTSSPDSILNPTDELLFTGWTTVPYAAYDAVTGARVATFASFNGNANWAPIFAN